MADEKKEVNIAIIGLGKVGSTFLAKLAEKERQGVKIVAAAEKNESAPGVAVAKGKGIKVYRDNKDIIVMGEAVDVIFDLTGNQETRRSLRSELARSGNQHTVIAPEIIAYLMWDVMGGGGELKTHGTKGGGY